MSHRLRHIVVSALIVSSSVATAADPYARVTETDAGKVMLEMCERSFVPVDGDGPRIHLISAIHIADQSFYEGMQVVLESYDSVLFEGVKPAGLDSIDPDMSDQAIVNATQDRLELLLEIAGGFYQKNNQLPENIAQMIEMSEPRIAEVVESIKRDGWGELIITTRTQTMIQDEMTETTIAFRSLGADRAIGGEGVNADIERTSKTYSPSKSRKSSPEGIQTQLANALHVAFQLDEMDMTGKGWVNADIDINTLQAQLAEMGEDNAMILQLLEGNSLQAKLIGFVLRFVERSPTMSSMMKLAMMDMLALVESSNIMSQFDAVEDVILHGRNDIVIQYLKAELAENPDHDDIAIFYGAAHMPGIEEVILNELGYAFESNTWAQAMTVNIKDTGLNDGQVKMMRNMIKSSLDQQFDN